MVNSVYGTLLWDLWLLLVKHFYVTSYICLTCIIAYGLWSWTIFFFCIYLCYFFCYTNYTFFLTYCHIVMIINSKLVIDHDILQNILAKYRPNRTFYIAKHMYLQNWGVVRTVRDGFDQTIPQSVILKMA